jgi:hypothetical protein
MREDVDEKGGNTLPRELSVTLAAIPRGHEAGRNRSEKYNVDPSFGVLASGQP